MRTSTIGLLAGLLIAIAAAAGGFTGFLLALLFGAGGYLYGSYRDGEVDLQSILRGRGRG